MNTLPAPASASVVGACPCFAKKNIKNTLSPISTASSLPVPFTFTYLYKLADLLGTTFQVRL